MKYIRMAAWCSIAGFILSMAPSVGPVVAQQKSNEANDRKTETAVSAPVYRPPKRGAPGGRVGGGTRGFQREVFVLSVLAPDHTGLTVSEQPFL